MSYDIVFWKGSPDAAPNVVWSRLVEGENGAFALEARLRLPDRGGFTFKLITRDRDAPPRHQLEQPLGPA